MHPPRLRALFPGALAALVALTSACSDSPTAPSSGAGALPKVDDRQFMPPGMAMMYPMLSTSPCAANGEPGGEPMLAISGSDLNVSTLPTPAGGGRILAVNNSGVAVGYVIAGGISIAYKWTPTAGGAYIATALGNPLFAAGGSEASGINNLGDIVGYARNAGGAQRAVVWPGGAPGGTALGVYGVAPYTLASNATDINDAGKIVGYAAGVSGSTVVYRAIVFTTSTATPVPGSTSFPKSNAYGVNASGDVAGEISGSVTGTYQAARNLASVGSWEILSPLPTYDRGSSQDINDARHSAGWSQKLPANTADRGAYWSPTTAALLDTVSAPGDGKAIGSYAAALSSPAIPADLRIVGFTGYTSGARHATLWQPLADPVDLGKPVGACGSQATTIADNGDWVCGFGYFPGYELPACWHVNYPPVISGFSTTDATCDAPATVSATFTAKSADAGPWHYKITWGDGAVSEGDEASPGTINGSHQYAAAGSYSVQVTITDKNGKTVSSEVKTVKKAPCPPEVTVVATKASYVCDEAGAVNVSFTSSANAGPYAYSIDWGDGSAPTTGSAAAPGTIPASHAYALGGGTYTVKVTVTNAFGESDDATTTITKVACTVDVTSFVSAKAAYACDEVASVSATFTSNSPSAAPYAVVIDWGDGNSSNQTAGAPGAVDATHDYALAGTYTAKVTVTDQYGNTDSETVQVVKEDCAPEVTVVATKAQYVCDEAGAVNVSFTSSANAGPYAYTINWGDGSTPTTGSAAAPGDIPASHAYALGAGSYTVTVTVTNKFGESGSATTQIVKVPCTVDVTSFVAAKPTLSCTDDASVTATFTSNSPTAAPYTYTIEWGDGSPNTTGAESAQGAITKTHDYAGAGTYTVKVTVADQYGNTDSETLTVTKEKCAPEVSIVATKASYVCDEAGAVDVSFTSSANAGPYAYSINWGDGSAPTTGSAAAPGTIPASHGYALGAGSYTVTVTITNKYGESGTASTTVTKVPCTVDVTSFVSAKAAYACDEVASVSATFVSNSPTAAPYSYVIEWGDGSPNTTGSESAQGSISKTHGYTAAGTYTAKITVTDQYGNTDSETVQVVKEKCAPEVTVVATKAQYVCDENGAVNVSFTSSANAGPYAYSINWGDGSAPTTGSAAAPGTIPASHAYALGAGTYTVTVTVTNKYGQTGTSSTSVVKVPCTVDVTSFVAAKATLSCTESASVTATFVSNSPTAAPYSYTITWGDGTNTTGTESASGSITKGHDYAAAGTYTVKVTVTDQYGNTDSETITVVKEACAPEISLVTTKASYVCDEAGAINVAFTSSANAGPYTYVITWGDGSPALTGSVPEPTTATIPHTYPLGAGTYTVTAKVTNRFGESSTATTTVTKVACTVDVTSFAAVKAEYACGEVAAVKATFGSNSPTAAPYAYAISWGDGSATNGSAAAPGSIDATHDYALPGTYSVTITVTDKYGNTASKTTTVEKEGCPPSVTVVSTKASFACDEVAGIKASFTSTGNAGPYAYSIDWGDGSAPTTGSAMAPGDIPATHAYAPGDGSYDVKVTVTNKFGESASAITTVVKDDCETKILTFASVQGQYSCGETASLAATFGSSSATAGPWHYVFAWGDGTITEGDALAPGMIAGTHKYLTDGTFTATITVTDRFGNAATQTTTVTQAPCPPKIEELVIAKATIGCGEPAQVSATFSSNGATGPYAYTISWGDGTPAQTGAGTPGEAIVGSHNYATNGSFLITFTVQGSKGPAVSKTVSVTRNCVPTPPRCDVCVLTPTITKGQTAAVSAKFLDATGDGPWSYEIQWGDGTKTTGTVTSLDAAITGTHVYNTAGTYTVKVKVTDKTGAVGECTSSIVVKAPPPPTAPRCDAGCSVTDYAKVGETVSVGANFTDTSTDGPWSFVIDWGDGKTSTGSVGSISTRITGSHVYTTAGTYTIKITVKDKYGITGDCYSKVVVRPPPPPTPPTCESCVSTAYSKVGESISVTSQFQDGSGDGPWTYEINWGDGTAKTTGTKTSLYGGITGTHTYTTAGTYTVTIKVTDKTGAIGYCYSKVVVKPPPPPTPPTCRSCVSNTSVRAGETVNISSEFSDDSNTGPYTYVIDWGDGTKSTGTKTSLATAVTGSHAYTAGGNYTIKVTVTDKNGVSGYCISKVSVCPPVPPRCNSCSNTSVTAWVNQKFTVSSGFRDDSRDGAWTFEIDWGDGTAKTTGSKTSLSTEVSGYHYYNRTGTFTVKVKLTDRMGNSGWCTYTVTVRR